MHLVTYRCFLLLWPPLVIPKELLSRRCVIPECGPPAKVVLRILALDPLGPKSCNVNKKLKRKTTIPGPPHRNLEFWPVSIPTTMRTAREQAEEGMIKTWARQQFLRSNLSPPESGRLRWCLKLNPWPFCSGWFRMRLIGFIARKLRSHG